MNTDVSALFPKSYSEAAMRARISHYHVLSLPISASREQVLERLELFRDHRYNYLRNSAKVSYSQQVDQDFLIPIAEVFENESKARSYQIGLQRDAQARRDEISRVTIEKELTIDYASLFSGERFGLISGEINSIISSAERAWRQKKTPSTTKLIESAGPRISLQRIHDFWKTNWPTYKVRARGLVGRARQTISGRPRLALFVFGCVVAVWTVPSLLGRMGVERHIRRSSVHNLSSSNVSNVKSAVAHERGVAHPITVHLPRRTNHEKLARPIVLFKSTRDLPHTRTNTSAADDLAKKLDP